MMKKILLALTLLLFAFVISGCDNENKPLVKPSDQKVEDKKNEKEVSFIVYRVDKTEEWLIPEKHINKIAEKENVYKVVLETLVNKKPTSEGTINIFPEKTKIIAVTLENGLATVNLSKEIMKNETGGSLYELLAITSIVNTLTEFPEIKKVQILVESRKYETLT